MRPVQSPATAMSSEALRLEWRLRLMEQQGVLVADGDSEAGDHLGLRLRIADVELEMLRRCWEATR